MTFPTNERISSELLTSRTATLVIVETRIRVVIIMRVISDLALADWRSTYTLHRKCYLGLKGVRIKDQVSTYLEMNLTGMY